MVWARRARRGAVGALGTVVVVVTLTSVGCSDDRPSVVSTTTAPPTTIGPQPTFTVPAPAASEPPAFDLGSQAFRYGDDPELDRLWDECAAGKGASCDELYHAAPVDSEYEAFGYTCGNRPNVIICTELDELAGTTTTTRG